MWQVFEEEGATAVAEVPGVGEGLVACDGVAGAKGVADEDFDFAQSRYFAAVEGLDVVVDHEAFPEGIVAVACDEALEVSGFVEDGGEEVVVACGEAIWSGAVGGVG